MILSTRLQARCFRLNVFVLLFGILSIHPAIAETDVGAQEISVFVPARQKPIKAMAWYPTAERGASTLIGDNAVFAGTPAQIDAPAKNGRYPMILIAHGGFRSAPNAASWLASRLAQKGFIAVVVTPPALPKGPPDQSVLEEVWQRPADLSAVLTALTGDGPLAANIDQDRIGIVGFFLGGTSVLRLVGARMDAKAYAGSCGGPTRSIPDCTWFSRGKVDLQGIDAALLQESNLDARIKAAIAIDPELTETFTDRSLKAVSVPIDVVNLGNAEQIPRSLDASALGLKVPGSRYQMIEDTTSFSAFSQCKPKGLAILKSEGDDGALCQEPGKRTRENIHDHLATLIEAALQGSFSQAR